ncbi:alcohol dehydrogenase [Marinobacter sp. G11]|jgi:NADPH:quinone reductase-like Zn-dependent oxidoreductase|uniref:alcohol dehydrogenase catalytic domain-containing protein n=1 Tax=Marinobacter sp. G11 TaxID=2903522 RepID=UPI001E42D30E|nr:alcohol dehydrogenase [Marinobacter sp. G11]MCE0761110.1 alcohol dehydrogenase [Marinobacter sp. G11]
MISNEKQPELMQAWVWSKADRAIELAERPMPTLGAGQVLVANKAIGLNPVDWKFIESDRGELWQDGQIPGVDGAGVVVAVADERDRHWLGVPVCYHQSLLQNGSFAEYTALNARALIRLPQALAWTAAAAFPCPVMTAWQAIEKIPTQVAAKILISGASGAVGRVLIQLAKARGFHVTAVASGTRHDILMELGASRCVAELEYLQDSFFAVFDTVSGAHAAQLAPYVEANGHLVCIQDRLEHAVVAPFSTAISQHEVALNALHSTGSDSQWQRFTEAAETLVQQHHLGELVGPDTRVAEFAQLKEALSEFKNQRKALKYCVALA